MESLVLLIFVVAWLLLGVLAIRFGHDSRDGIDRPPDGALWHHPGKDPWASRRRTQYNRERAWGWSGVPQPPPRPMLAAARSANPQSSNGSGAREEEKRGGEERYAMTP